MLNHTFNLFYIRSSLLFFSLKSKLRSLIFPSLLWCRRSFRLFNMIACVEHSRFSLFFFLHDEWWIWAVNVLFLFNRRHHVAHSLFKFCRVSITRMIVSLHKLLYSCVIELRFFFREYLFSDMKVVLNRCLERNELLLEDFVTESDAFFLLIIKFLQRFDFLGNSKHFTLQFIETLFVCWLV